MERIETGVDKLLVLINKEKKIELAKAAKSLGMPEEVIQEWADFLEEEKLISIEYSLSKTYLQERQLSKKEVAKKEKEYVSKKDAFTRKVDTTLKKLEKNTAGFEDIKKQYYALKQEIGDEISQVKDEVEELRHYEDLKKSIDRDILQQKVDYEKSLGGLHKRISAEEKRYGKIHEEILKEGEVIASERKDLNELKQQEETLTKRLDALKEVITSVKNQLSTEDKAINHHEERLTSLKTLAEGLAKDIQEKREKELAPLVASSKKHQEKIIGIQDTIIQKIKNRKAEIAKHETQGLEIAKRFEKFFNKKADTERIVVDLEKQKQDMQDDLQELIKKAKSFDLAAQSADTKKHIKALETQFNEFEHKQTTFIKRLGLLKNLISGKEVPQEKKPGKKQK